MLPSFIKNRRTLDYSQNYIESELQSSEQRTQFINKNLTSLEIKARNIDHKLRTHTMKQPPNTIETAQPVSKSLYPNLPK